jgi:beta-galactosidase
MSASKGDGMRNCFEKLLLSLLFLTTLTAPAAGQNFPPHPSWPGPGQLFVGPCYQPIDRAPEQIDGDIAIMKGAGFNVVRMGDLSWDSFEPLQGKFEFEWLDKIMDKMKAAGIRVILDIPGMPAPIWLHRAYPVWTSSARTARACHPRNATWITSATRITCVKPGSSPTR